MQTPSKGPTLSQLEMLRAIWEMTHEKGWPPSFRELCERLNRTSTNGVGDTLRILQREGWIVRENMASRCIRVTDSGVALLSVDKEKFIHRMNREVRSLSAENRAKVQDSIAELTKIILGD